MSNNPIQYTYELVIRFTEDADRMVNWSVLTDESAKQFLDAGYEELAEEGAPLSLIGILILRDTLCQQGIDLALNKADNYRWRKLFKSISEAAEGKEAFADTLGGDALEVVH